MQKDREKRGGTAPGGGRRARHFAYLLLFLLTTISYIDRTTLSVAAPSIAEEFGLSPVETGYLLSSFLWTYVLALVPVGIWVDRSGARLVAASGVALWSFATVLAGFVHSFAALLVSRLALGAGESTAYPAGMRVVRDLAPPEERGLATAFLNGGSYAGPALGALLTGALIASFGWRFGFIVLGGAGFLWLVPWLLFYRGSSEALHPSPSVTEPDGTVSSEQAAGLGALLAKRATWATALTQGCAVYAQYFFLTWLPSYLHDVKGFDIQATGLYTAIPYAASVVFSLAICRLSDRLLRRGDTGKGQRRYMVGAMMLLSSAVLLTPFADSVGTIILLVSLSLTGISSAISLNFALSSDLLETSRDSGKAASILVVGGNIFGFLAPIATGYVIEFSGSYNGAFTIAGVLLLIGAISVVSLATVRRR